jgi:hypothetical protein
VFAQSDAWAPRSLPISAAPSFPAIGKAKGSKVRKGRGDLQALRCTRHRRRNVTRLRQQEMIAKFSVCMP